MEPALDAAEPITKTKVLEGYLDWVLQKGENPTSVYSFAKSLGLEEEDFYRCYNSFEAVERDLWRGFFQQTVARIEGSETYRTYSVREKLLAFYYTWVEVLKSRRSFVLISLNERARRTSNPRALRALREDFLRWARALIAEGLDKGEVMQRPLLSDRYAEGLWVQFLFVLQYWVKDDSAGFEDTDAAIEKAVRLSFDLMGPNSLDSAVDFVRFLWRNR